MPPATHAAEVDRARVHVDEAAHSVRYDQDRHGDVARHRLRDAAGEERGEAMAPVGAGDDQVRGDAANRVDDRVGHVLATLVADAFVLDGPAPSRGERRGVGQSAR